MTAATGFVFRSQTDRRKSSLVSKNPVGINMAPLPPNLYSDPLTKARAASVFPGRPTWRLSVDPGGGIDIEA